MEHDRHVIPFRREAARRAATDRLAPVDPLDLFASEEPTRAPSAQTLPVGNPLDAFGSEHAPRTTTPAVSDDMRALSAARLPSHTGFWIVLDSLIPIAIGAGALYFFFLR
jgi:hypothetical protein